MAIKNLAFSCSSYLHYKIASKNWNYVENVYLSLKNLKENFSNFLVFVSLLFLLCAFQKDSVHCSSNYSLASCINHLFASWSMIISCVCDKLPVSYLSQEMSKFSSHCVFEKLIFSKIGDFESLFRISDSQYLRFGEKIYNFKEIRRKEKHEVSSFMYFLLIFIEVNLLLLLFFLHFFPWNW